jgi:uncharacterized protein with HEPN domain
MRTNQERLQDIIESCELILDYMTRLRSGSRAEDEDVFHDAILHQLTILGEAVVHVDVKIKIKYSEIPWDIINAFRNVLVHEYSSIRWDRVWDAVDRIPLLLESIKNILQKEYGTTD